MKTCRPVADLSVTILPTGTQVRIGCVLSEEELGAVMLSLNGVPEKVNTRWVSVWDCLSGKYINGYGFDEIKPVDGMSLIEVFSDKSHLNKRYIFVEEV